MPPKGNRKTETLKTQPPKLWLLLVAVGDYRDKNLKFLPYSVEDCEELAQAFENAATKFSEIKKFIHHAQTDCKPQLENVRASLQEIVKYAQLQDTLFIYFSVHGLLEKEIQQVVLCLENTQTDKLLETGLPVQKLLEELSKCPACEQTIVLDACHSGGINLSHSSLAELLQQHEVKKTFFCALLSCDRDQESLKFPELEHGLFTYNLIRGLRGEAANAKGEIEIYGLYKYIYHRTLQYIGKTNQQNHLINQIRIQQGNTDCLPEHKLQTPKLIMKAVGEMVLGLKRAQINDRSLRKALIIEGFFNAETTLELSLLLRQKGNFQVEYLASETQDLSKIKTAIQDCLGIQKETSATILLYLRGCIDGKDGEFLILENGIQISRYWLKKQLLRSNLTQQIIIIDCPGAISLEDWLQELRIESRFGQCLIAGASTIAKPEEFATALLKPLKNTNEQNGFPVASWIAEIQKQLIESKIWRNFLLWSLQGVIEILPPPTGNTQLTDLGICPYKGLQAFDVNDAKFFYGREELTQKIINEISQQSFLAVVGASGSGKSSVVQAGLMARLKGGRYLPESEQWWIKSFRPGTNPLQALAKILVDKSDRYLELLQELEKCQELAEGQLYLGWQGFSKWLYDRSEPMVVLVIDQFEELFTLAASSERQQFLDIILPAVEHHADRFKLVITLRADFIPSCLAIPQLYQYYDRSHISVPPNLDDYRQVIVKPAEKVGLEVESELVEELLSKLDNAPGNLPILEFVLEQLWEMRQFGKLTLKAYQKSIGGLEGALDRKADAVYHSLDPKAQSCAESIFLELTQLGEGTEDTRRRVSKSQLFSGKFDRQLVENTLRILSQGRLIVMDGEEENQDVGAGFPRPSPSSASLRLFDFRRYKTENAEISLEIEQIKKEITVEVAHEIIIRNWKTLRWWLEKNRTRLREQREIEQAAKRWEQKNKSPALLLRGKPLLDAEYLDRNYRDDLKPLEREYIQTSKNARRVARMAIGTTATTIISVIATIGIFAGLERQKFEREQLLRYVASNVITPENAQVISRVLPNYLESANKLRETKQIDKAINDYRQIFVLTNTLQQKISENSEKFQNIGQEQQIIREIAQKSSQSLAETIRQYRLPELEQELKLGNFGKFVEADFAKFENQYTGALKITYAILMRDRGAQADMNNDGYLTEGEEIALPCQTLKDIEDLWRKYTQNRCGWYGNSNIYQASTCRELGDYTLTFTLNLPFRPSIPLMESRLKQCQLGGMNDEGRGMNKVNS